MNKLANHRDELLEAVKEPKKSRKKPSNNSLLIALIFADIIFGVLDIGSGITVYWLTGVWFYGVLVFLAGITPLLLFQKLYTRAFANEEQKKIAISGAVLAVFSIIIIGVLSAIANVAGIGGVNAELAVVIAVVVLAFVHALLLTWYFYIDDGILADQTVERTLARAIQQGKLIEAGDFILTLTQRSVNRRKAIGNKYGSMEALREVLSQLSMDADGDGIPDVVDPVDDRTGEPFPANPFRTARQYGYEQVDELFGDDGQDKSFQ